MSKKKIENPKVFISYAWGTEEYQKKVLEFSTQLMADGIDVVLDKWDLSEGNDTYAFMEKSANDKSITNVLMLLDPIYAEKADSHKGGVGTETQIISAQVYNEVTQDKFIPIVFERDDTGNVCKPTYLKGRLHFDLSDEERYDEEYTRLIKFLYGVEVYRKPELGKKPVWVEQQDIIEIKKRTGFEAIKNTQPDKARKKLFTKFLDDMLREIRGIIEVEDHISDYNDVLSFYENFRKVRTDYNTLLEYSCYVDGAEEILASKLEEAVLSICSIRIQTKECSLAKIFIHELFLYTVASYLKEKDYDALGYILWRTYYDPSRYDDKYSGYDVFYSGRYDLLDLAMNKRDNKNYHSGTATFWMETIDAEHVTKEEFILADLVCYNISIYGKDTLVKDFWFPETYIYDNEYKSVLNAFCQRLVSKEYALKLLPLFNYESVDDLKKYFEDRAEKIKTGEFKYIRYPNAWQEAPLFNSYIDYVKIATAR